jgi:hypothetical protein
MFLLTCGSAELLVALLEEGLLALALEPLAGELLGLIS